MEISADLFGKGEVRLRRHSGLSIIITRTGFCGTWDILAIKYSYNSSRIRY